MRSPALVRASLIACALLACVRDRECEGGHRLFGGRCLELDAGVTTRWGFAPETIRLADLDGDGATDVVAASHAIGAVSVVWGAADLSLETATTWSVAPAIAGLAVVDLDGDGRLDVVTAAPDDDAVAVLRGRGGRELAAPELHATAVAGPAGVVALDLDGDAAPELVTLHPDPGSLAVLRGLEPAGELLVGPGPRHLAVGDLDGDGDLDLAVALTEAAAVQVVLGDGAGGLEPGPRHPVGVAPFAVLAADLDGDGALDLATADALSDSVSLLYGDGAGRLRARAVFPTDPDPRALALVREGDSGHVLYVLSYETSTLQRLDPRRGVDLTGAAREPVRALAVGDLDGDGGDDLVYAASGELGRLAPAPGFTLAPRWQTDRAIRAFPIDLDGDGRHEIAVRPAPTEDAVLDPERTASVQIWRDGAAEPATIDLDPLKTLSYLRAADLDGRPGRELIAWGGGDVIVFTADEDAWTPGEPYPVAGVNDILVADRDGDGRPELLLVRTPERDTILDVVTLDDDGRLAPGERLELGSSVARISARDHDGDGDDALLVVRGGLLHVFDGDLEPRAIDLDGVGVFGAHVFSDLDDDGRLDAIVCASAGLLRIGDIFGAAPAEPERIDRVGCRALALHDLDVDGRLDLLVETGDSAGGQPRTILTPWLRGGHGWTRLASQSLPTGGVTLVRLDDDPWPELLVTDLEQPARLLDLSFGPSIGDDPLFSGALGYRFVDLDGDGVLDLLGLGRGIAVAHGDGAGGFAPVQQRRLDGVLPGADAILSAAVDDFDHDGHAEAIVVAQRAEGWRSDLVRVELDPAAAPVVEPLAELPRIFTQLARADLDGDRVLDLLATAGAPAPQFAVLRGRGDGSFAAGTWRAIDFEKIGSALRLVDLDGDARLDLLESRSTGLALHRGLGDGRFAAPQQWTDLQYAGLVAFHDVDRDGRRDVAAITSGGLVLLRGRADGPAHPPQVLFADAATAAVADLDGDGQLEFFVGTFDALHIGRRDPDGVVRFVEHPREGAASGFAVADFDGDGFRDLGLYGAGGVTIVRQTQ